MEKVSIQGNCAKFNWYKILDCIDQLKQEGWFIQGKTKIEKDERVDFNYTLNKHLKS